MKKILTSEFENLKKPTTAPLGDRTTHRVDFIKLSGKPATNQKPRDKINIDKNRKLESRGVYQHDFTCQKRDASAQRLYKLMLGRARARPDELPGNIQNPDLLTKLSLFGPRLS